MHEDDDTDFRLWRREMHPSYVDNDRADPLNTVRGMVIASAIVVALIAVFSFVSYRAGWW